MLTGAIFATALLTTIVVIFTPPDADVRACHQQARAAAGAPSVSPRSQPATATPGRDTQRQDRTESRPPRRETPSSTPPDVGAHDTPWMPGADGSDAYRAAFQTCLHTRGF